MPVSELRKEVKGAANSLLARSFKNGDAEQKHKFYLSHRVCFKRRQLHWSIFQLAGELPLGHALNLARTYLTPTTVLILLTDGRANVPRNW
jgi:magnesium chelatase subunit D